MFDSPSKHPRISIAEREYIEKSLGHTGEVCKMCLIVLISNANKFIFDIGHINSIPINISNFTLSGDSFQFTFPTL